MKASAAHIRHDDVLAASSLATPWVSTPPLNLQPRCLRRRGGSEEADVAQQHPVAHSPCTANRTTPAEIGLQCSHTAMPRSPVPLLVSRYPRPSLPSRRKRSTACPHRCTPTRLRRSEREGGGGRCKRETKGSLFLSSNRAAATADEGGTSRAQRRAAAHPTAEQQQHAAGRARKTR
ncbi:hypothetical protein PR202_ga22289 [Eleusine coracana subsp. coracana]|uniref:Uncharacterized protein n=1 Tax=Eleusine coracana subsp. coracana TaxID=191504 RepID=A0AAV5D279_ELECO|nr:hypothetical protein PR202_ga22289 [Eleusine coracana subsp. coracana]